MKRKEAQHLIACYKAAVIDLDNRGSKNPVYWESIEANYDKCYDELLEGLIND